MEIQTINKGAELTSVKYNGVERLHDAKTFWDQHSPVLFPIVGKLRYGTTLINGKEYEIPKHGFAMNMDFEKIGEHSYKLTSNEKTLKNFPFEFELFIFYTIDKNKLTFNYKILNKSKEKMLCGLGGHPAFKCNYSNEKCSVEFEKEENEVKIIPVDISCCLLSNKFINGEKLIKNKKILELKKNSFENDAIILTGMKSKYVILKDNGKQLLKFNFDGFDYLGIWSQENAPFVCFEPWYNTPDYVDSSKEFKEKKNIIEIEPGKEFKINFSVEFYD